MTVGKRRKTIRPEAKRNVLILLKDFSPKQVKTKTGLSLSSVYKIQQEAQMADADWDTELGPHRKRLFYFGQRLRDRLDPEAGRARSSVATLWAARRSAQMPAILPAA